jgi:hypothetical protein
MSEGAPTPAPAKPEDPVKALARQIYISLAAQTYAGSADAKGKPDPKLLGKLSFQLAAGFIAADEEINAEVIAKEKARNNFNVDDLDLGVPVPPAAAPAAAPAAKPVAPAKP